MEKLGKTDKSFYLRFKIQKPLDLPNDQQCMFFVMSHAPQKDVKLPVAPT